MHQLGRITPVREHYTVSQLVQCCLNGVTPVSNKPRRGSRSDSYTLHCPRYGTLHPLRDAAPVTGRCTRSERVHCLRIGCSAHTHKHNRGHNSLTPPSQSPIPHVIPHRPHLAAPQKPQNSNVLTSIVEAPAGELRAKFRGHTGTGTQLTTRYPTIAFPRR